MDKLGRKAFSALAKFMVFLAALLFLTAGTLAFWQGWAYLAVFGLVCAVTTDYIRRHDPELLRRRMSSGPTAERRPSQKLIQLGNSLAGIALYAAAGCISGSCRWCGEGASAGLAKPFVPR